MSAIDQLRELQAHRDDLLAENERLREALAAFVEWDDRETDHSVAFDMRCALYSDAITQARAALAAKP